MGRKSSSIPQVCKILVTKDNHWSQLPGLENEYTAGSWQRTTCGAPGLGLALVEKIHAAIRAPSYHPTCNSADQGLLPKLGVTTVAHDLLQHL